MRTTTPSAPTAAAGVSGEDLFFDLAIEDLRRAADMFLGDPRAHRRASTGGSRSRCHRSWPTTPGPRWPRRPTCTAAPARQNLFIKIPGTPEGLPAIEETIAAGVPVNVTLLFDAAQYRAAAEAYMRGVRAPDRRRARSGRRQRGVGVHVALGQGGRRQVPAELKDRLALAVGARHLPGLPRAARLGPLAAHSRAPGPGRSGCCGPARRTKDPGRARHALRRRAGRAPDGQHDAGLDPRGLPRPRRRWASSLPADGGDADAALAPLRRCRRRRDRAGSTTADRRRRRRSSPPGRT